MEQILKVKNLKSYVIILLLISLVMLMLQLISIREALTVDRIVAKGEMNKIENIISDSKTSTFEKRNMIEAKVENNIETNIISTKKDIRIDRIIKLTGLDEETAEVIIKYSEEFNISLSLLLALIDLESNFKQYEIGNSMDRGYCQIIPDTEKWLIETYGQLLNLKYNPNRIFEPEYNIGLCALYLNHLQKNYQNNYHRILSEYNRGPYNLADYYRRNNTYATSYSNAVLERQEKYKFLD
jgi:soluble lytic murein transglycosylase-like protein